MPAPISVSRPVAAPASAVFAVLTDPAAHTDIDGSGTVRQAVFGPSPLVAGSRFGISMRYWGLPYRMVNRVVEFEPDRRIAWKTLAGVVWRYELQPTDGGCVVTETWDTGGSPFGPAYRLLRFPDRTLPAIQGTLDRLAARVEPAPAP
jgi:hypothetical protein